MIARLDNNITTAAIKTLDGVIHTLPRPARHHTLIRLCVEKGYPKPIKGEQGFLTDSGKFCDRVVAKEIAKRMNQWRTKDYIHLEELTSEELW